MGTSIGKAVAATDADNDVLVYELVDATDNQDPPVAIPANVGDKATFKIDRNTGQIKLGEKVNFEAEDGGTPKTTYIVRVKASDPSGADASVDVTIMVDDVNEAPAFATAAVTTLWVTENDDSNTLRIGEAADTGVSSPYGATDVDGNNTNDGTPGLITNPYGKSGADAESFTVAPSTGELTFVADHEVDYETKSSYLGNHNGHRRKADDKFGDNRQGNGC